MYRISFLGSGRVAWHLAQALENAGHYIEEVWSRNPEHAEELVDHLYAANPQKHLDFSKSNASIFILSVTDAAVEELARQVILPQGAIIVHTSGTLGMEVLEQASLNFGVFYPLQTFTKQRGVAFEEVPFCLEAVNRPTLKHLKKLAGSLSKKVYEIDGEKRRVLHLSAVFACNFTNHMLRISGEILAESNIDANVLYPLITETIEKSMAVGPQQAQTGPAVRHDEEVMATHIEQLEDQPKWAELYFLISQDIMRLHQD